MSYREMMTLECRCGCGEFFSTRKTNKFYVDITHQKPNNNRNQYDKQRKLRPIQQMEKKTYEIYKKQLGRRMSVRLSREFLKGCGANLGLLNHFETINGKQEHALFDIAIIADRTDSNFLIIKKINNE
jgi:hypothetical protein